MECTHQQHIIIWLCYHLHKPCKITENLSYTQYTVRFQNVKIPWLPHVDIQSFVITFAVSVPAVNNK